MSEKRYPPACEKFEGSQQLDPALGTMLRLADCYDRAARSASAWALFREAASLARTRGEAERERIATERAAELEKRLSKLEIRVDRKNAPPGLEIQLNAMNVPRASWDTPMPVDPGPQRISASAADKTSWSTTLQIAPGQEVRTVEIPVLAARPRPDGHDANALAGANVTAGEGSGGGRANLRGVGYVAGSLAIAGVAIGSLLTFKAHDANQQSLAQCRFDDPNACTPQGKDERDHAKALGDGATIVFIASGAILASSVVLLLSTRATEPRAQLRELKAAATASPNGAGLRLEGTW
jgi:serine/threonine-protein kinase